MTLPEMKKECQSKVSIEYWQAGPVAKVKGTIANETCAESGGSFVIVVTIKDKANETKTLEFPQTWMREDDQGVNFSGNYDIGDNVSLWEAHVSKVHCNCVKQEKTGD